MGGGWRRGTRGSASTSGGYSHKSSPPAPGQRPAVRVGLMVPGPSACRGSALPSRMTRPLASRAGRAGSASASGWGTHARCRSPSQPPRGQSHQMPRLEQPALSPGSCSPFSRSMETSLLSTVEYSFESHVPLPAWGASAEVSCTAAGPVEGWIAFAVLGSSKRGQVQNDPALVLGSWCRGARQGLCSVLTPSAYQFQSQELFLAPLELGAKGLQDQVLYPWLQLGIGVERWCLSPLRTSELLLRACTHLCHSVCQKSLWG